MAKTFFLSRAAGALLILAMTACAASATFHSKNGAEYPALTKNAVRCDENEARAVAAAGGDVIGTIDARAMTVQATDEDLFDKAMAVAAKNGGTHVVLTDKGVEQLTYYNPAREDTSCVQGDAGRVSNDLHAGDDDIVRETHGQVRRLPRAVAGMGEAAAQLAPGPRRGVSARTTRRLPHQSPGTRRKRVFSR